MPHPADLPEDVPLPAGAEVLEASGWRGTGNVLLKFPSDHEPAVLKIYRVRRSRLRELFRGFSHRFLEGKRGASARARRDTEERSLQVWAREGFDAVPLCQRTWPAELSDHPLLWLAYLPAPTLRDLLRRERTGAPRKAELVRRLASQACRRHQRALTTREELLVQEHAETNHVFVQGERLVVFDLENGFRKGFPLLEAMAQEVAGYARALVQDDPAGGDRLLRAWVEGYEDRDLHLRILEHALFDAGLFRRLKRWQDRRRADGGKTAVMARLLALVRERVP